MSRVHPAVNNSNKSPQIIGERQYNRDRRPLKFTVWKRSSMTFQGTDGFTVFDEFGRLAFRVDNYSRKNGCTGARGGGGLVLMDGAGNALLTLSAKGLSMQCEWNAYLGDCTGRDRPGRAVQVFSVTKKSTSFPFIGNYYKRKCNNKNEAGTNVEAEVFVGRSRLPEFMVEGSFRRRNCSIRSTSTGEVVAKVSRKRASPGVLLENEVFQPCGATWAR